MRVTVCERNKRQNTLQTRCAVPNDINATDWNMCLYLYVNNVLHIRINKESVNDVLEVNVFYY
jgi:hypothetical protein